MPMTKLARLAYVPYVSTMQPGMRPTLEYKIRDNIRFSSHSTPEYRPFFVYCLAFLPNFS